MHSGFSMKEASTESRDVVVSPWTLIPLEDSYEIAQCLQYQLEGEKLGQDKESILATNHNYHGNAEKHNISPVLII